MTENYLGILEESMIKKLEVLECIEDLNKEQESILKAEVLSYHDFDVNAAKKDEQIQELLKLDHGFQTLYDRVREELLAGREKYKEQIHRMQQFIEAVTEKSMTIQAQEARNKQLVEKKCAMERNEIREGRKNSKVALDYYRNMSQPSGVSPQFMDHKK